VKVNALSSSGRTKLPADRADSEKKLITEPVEVRTAGVEDADADAAEQLPAEASPARESAAFAAKKVMRCSN
jgi:hypothetical protein